MSDPAVVVPARRLFVGWFGLVIRVKGGQSS